MLMNRIMCLLSTTLLFTFPTESNISPFLPTEQSIEKQIDFNGMVQMQDYKLKQLQEQYQKDKAESDKKKATEERLREEKELEEQKKNEPQWQEFIVSFYTGLDEENSIYGAVNCKHLPLERGMVANNILPYGTKIFLDNDFGIRTVADTGSKIFNDSNRIDLYVAKWDGETKEQWRKRAESYGVRKIWGYIIK